MKTTKVSSKDLLKRLIQENIEQYGFECDLNHIDISAVTDLSNLFADSAFNGNISQWNTSNVTDVGGMFAGSTFNRDISRWNIDKVKHMEHMFFRSKFNGDISNWNTSSVIDMQHLFHGSLFNGDLSKWNVSNVFDMENLFYGCPFNGDISKWNIKYNCLLVNVFSKFHFSPIGILGLINNEYEFDNDVEWAAQFHKYKPIVEGLGLEGMRAARELYSLIKNDLDKDVIIEVNHNDFTSP